MVLTYPDVAILTKGTESIRILLRQREGIKHDFDKQILPITIPKQTPPLTYLLDLGKLLETITLNGYLNMDENEITPYQKKKMLRGWLQQAGTFKLTWDTNETDQPYTVNVNKATITEVVGRLNPDSVRNYGTAGSSDNTFKVYEIMIIFNVGTHKG